MKNIKNFLSISLSIILFYCCSLLTVSAEEIPPRSIPIFDIEAEDCTLTGCAINRGDDYGSDFTGSGYVEYIDQIGDSVSFVVTGFTGYALMSIRYSQGMSTDQTLSLFINSKFVRKINFEPTGLWDYTWDTIDVPCYMASGQTVTLKYTHGDGYVDIDSISCRPRAGDTTMFIVPHEDDEILGFCSSIYNLIHNGHDVKVVLMTNGDYNILDGSHTNMGRTRIRETVNALGLLDVPKENVIVLGYSDGILYDLYNNNTFTPPNGQTQTYGDDVLYKIYDYHLIQTGSHAAYTKANLLSDLTNIMIANCPSEIYTTSSFDTHGDHSSTYNFVCDAISNASLTPLLHETIIHGEDANWPPTYTNYIPPPTPTPFTNPFISSNPPLDFNSATKIQLTSNMLNLKYNAIGMFHSQNDSPNGMGFAAFNYAFYRSDEFYWTFDYTIMSYV